MNINLSDLKILSVLLNGDKYGIQIIEEIEKSGSSLLLGSLYNALYRLEKDGYVTSYWGKQTSKRGGNRRRYYKITAKGDEIIDKIQYSFIKLWNWKLS